MTRRLRVATRGSTLARKQAGQVIELLGGETEVVVVETLGDRRRDAEIWQLGGQGVFVKEVQAALLEARADLAVHSAKDLPSQPVAGLAIGAVPMRDDPRDALVGLPLDALPAGSRIGTGSVRRRAQLSWLRPDLTFGSLRGNMETRLAKASSFGAIVVAAAALNRLGRGDAIAEVLDPDVIVPQVGQGALAVECRADDAEVLERLAAIDHAPSHWEVDAERAYLGELGGGCDLPVGAHAICDDSAGPRQLTGLVATPDGRIVLRHTTTGADAAPLGRAVARYLLEDCGGASLLDALALTPAGGAGQ